MSSAKTILFVCEHGALRSRIAAAYFNAAPPHGWRARSAGREPQENVSPALAELLAGTPALDVLEAGPPRPVGADAAARTVAIDCAAAADERWDLEHRDADVGMRDELHGRVTRLVEVLRGD
jgi:hypothetical protein